MLCHKDSIVDWCKKCSCLTCKEKFVKFEIDNRNSWNIFPCAPVCVKCIRSDEYLRGEDDL